MTYWEWSTFPLENAMNNSLLPEEKKNSPRVLNQIVFSLFIRKKKEVYKVLSAFCILCHWSSDNWLCLGGSLLDMLRLSSGKRYSSKLSLPSQGTGRQRFTDLKRTQWNWNYIIGKKVSFRSIIPIGHTAHPCFYLKITESCKVSCHPVPFSQSVRDWNVAHFFSTRCLSIKSTYV